MKGFLEEEKGIFLIKQMIKKVSSEYQFNFTYSEENFFEISQLFISILSIEQKRNIETDFKKSVSSLLIDSFGEIDGSVIAESFLDCSNSIEEQELFSLQLKLHEIPITYLEKCLLLDLTDQSYLSELISEIALFYSNGNRELKKADFDFYKSPFLSVNSKFDKNLTGYIPNLGLYKTLAFIRNYLLNNKVELITFSQDQEELIEKYDLIYMQLNKNMTMYDYFGKLQKDGINSDSVLISVFGVLEALAENGTGIVVSSKATAFNSDNYEIRKWLVDNHYLEAVIEVNDKTSFSQGQFVIYILKKHSEEIKLLTVSWKSDNGIDELLSPKEVVQFLSKEKDYLDEIVEKYKVKENEFSCAKYFTSMTYEDYDDINTEYSLLASTYLYSQSFKCETKQLCKLAEIKRGSVKPVKSPAPLYSGKLLPYISQTNLENIIIPRSELSNTENDEKYQKYCVSKGFAIIVSRAWLQKFKIGFIEIEDDTEILVGPNMFIIQPNEEINPYYLLSFLLSPSGQRSLYGIATGNAVPFLNIEALKNLEIPIMNIEQMNQLGNSFREKLEKIEKARRELIEANQIFTSELSFFQSL